jgi:AsmA-like C-terminal region/AsmA family
VQTTLLGLAIAFIIALVAALIGPHFIDWNQFRPQFEAEATKVIGAPVHVGGALDARLLPTPSLRLRSVMVGGANDLGKVHADKLDVEFSLGDLMRGQWRANELTIDGLAADLGLDPRGQIELPASSGPFNLGSLSIDRLNLTGHAALHDAASHGTLELNNIAFSGDVRSLAGSVRGDGSFSVSGTRYPFRVSSGQMPDGSGTRLHLNIDPGDRALSVDVEGVLSFAQRAPRFEGALALAASAPKAKKNEAKAGDTSPSAWKISAKVKADPAGAKFDQVETSYGAEDAALKATGVADIRFGALPLLRASLSARQLDADRTIAKENAKESAKENTKDNTIAPAQLLPALRAFMVSTPGVPIPVQVAFSSEQIMLGGRPLQNLEADLNGDAKSWTIRRLDFRAPGMTHVAFNGGATQGDPAQALAGAFDIASSDPDALAAWLQGRSDIAYRGQKPLRLRGNIMIGSGHLAVEGLMAEINGAALEGRVAISYQSSGGSRLEAALKAEQLDLNSAAAFTRSLAGPQVEWPDQAQLTVDIGRATSAGQELRGFSAKFGYDPKTLILDQLKFGDANGVTTEARGRFDRADATGKLALNSSAGSLKQITALIEPLVPSLVSRIDSMGTGPGPARLKLALEVDKNAEHADRASAHATIELDSPLLKGVTTVTAKPEVAAIRSIDLEKLRGSEIGVESRLASARGSALLALLGLDHAVAAGDGPAQFEGSLSGVWRAPLRLKAKLSGPGLDAEVEGTAEPWTDVAKASVNLRVRSVNIGPLLGLKPSDTLAQNLRLSSRVGLIGNRLTFDDLDSVVGGSRLRGRLTVASGEEKNIAGEIGLDQLALAPAFSLAMGAAGHDAAEPIAAGFLKGWHGHVVFQALRGELPDGIELRPISGTIKSDGQSLTLDDIKGGIGSGIANANLDVGPSADGIALNARLEFSGVDGATLHYRGLKMPSGRASMQMTLASQGRSVSALAGALSGSGTLTLESAAIAGLDPRAFDVAIRASDFGQATDDARLKQIVEPVLSAGSLRVASAQLPFTIRDGRLRIGATTLDGQGARAIISGGYDILADQADLRASLASTVLGSATSRPEIQIFAAGPPDALNRTTDVAPLSSWLAVRAIDRETRRLDAIERGEPPPPATSALIAPSTAALPDATAPENALPGHAPRRVPLRPKAAAPRPPALNPPVVSQQAAPLPPPIEVRPAPAPPLAKPKPRPPLVITPPPN